MSDLWRSGKTYRVTWHTHPTSSNPKNLESWNKWLQINCPLVSTYHWYVLHIFFDGDGFSSVLLGMVHHDVSEVVFQSKKYIEISTYMVLPFFWAILKEGHAEMLGAVWRNQGSTMKLPSRGFRIIAVLRSPSRTPRVGLTWSCWFFWNRLGVFHPRPHFRPHFRGLQWSFVGSGVNIWDHHHIYV